MVLYLCYPADPASEAVNLFMFGMVARRSPHLRRSLGCCLCLLCTSITLLNYATYERLENESVGLLMLSLTMDEHLPSMTPFSTTPTFRSESDKIMAQACVRRGLGGIYLKHNRKAGGTTLMKMIQSNDACKARGANDTQVPTFHSELPYFNYSHAFGRHIPTLVFVTSLRSPIDRIVSLYFFEGRWPRTCGAPCENRKNKTNETAVGSLDEWVDAILHQSDTPGRDWRLTFHNNCGIWQGIDNYYIRQFLGIDRDVRRERVPKKYRDGRSHDFDTMAHYRNVTLTRSHLELAKKVLASFDLVVILEELDSNLDLQRMLLEITRGNANHDQVPAPLHERTGRERRGSKYFPPTIDE